MSTTGDESGLVERLVIKNCVDGLEGFFPKLIHDLKSNT